LKVTPDKATQPLELEHLQASELKRIQTHRSWMMRALAGHFISIGGGSWYLDNTPLAIKSIEDTPLHVGAIVELANIMPKTFPQGSVKGSRASPLIWREPEKFQQELVKLQSAAERLASISVADDLPAFEQAMLEVYSTCRSCHSAFRE